MIDHVGHSAKVFEQFVDFDCGGDRCFRNGSIADDKTARRFPADAADGEQSAHGQPPGSPRSGAVCRS